MGTTRWGATVTIEEVETYERIETGDSIGTDYLRVIETEQDLTYVGRGEDEETPFTREEQHDVWDHIRRENAEK